jgi:hypothetical protein
VADFPVTVVGCSTVTSTNLRPRKYRKVCTAVGTSPTDRGWEFLRCLDTNGQRLTLVTEDVDYIELLIAGAKAGGPGDLDVPIGTFHHQGGLAGRLEAVRSNIAASRIRSRVSLSLDSCLVDGRWLNH